MSETKGLRHSVGNVKMGELRKPLLFLEAGDARELMVPDFLSWKKDICWNLFDGWRF